MHPFIKYLLNRTIRQYLLKFTKYLISTSYILTTNISYFIQNVNRNLKFFSKLNLLVCSAQKGKFVNICTDNTSRSVLLFCCYMEKPLHLCFRRNGFQNNVLSAFVVLLWFIGGYSVPDRKKRAELDSKFRFYC